jgi:hypothetical protein
MVARPAWSLVKSRPPATAFLEAPPTKLPPPQIAQCKRVHVNAMVQVVARPRWPCVQRALCLSMYRLELNVLDAELNILT